MNHEKNNENIKKIIMKIMKIMIMKRNEMAMHNVML